MAHHRFANIPGENSIAIWDAHFVAKNGDDDDQHAVQGHLFYVIADEDFLPVEIFVNEAIPGATLAKVKAFEAADPEYTSDDVRAGDQRCLLRIDSGEACVGSLEDFGKSRETVKTISLPPGSYAVRVFQPDARARVLVPLPGTALQVFCYHLGAAAFGLSALSLVLAAIGLWGFSLTGDHGFMQACGLAIVSSFVLGMVLLKLPSTTRMLKQQAAFEKANALPLVLELKDLELGSQLTGGHIRLWS